MKLGLFLNRRFMVLHALLGVVCAFVLMGAVPAQAATGINKTINFQGRLLNSQGATVPDGYYNIEFKIYQDGDGQSVGDTTGSPAGSLKWTEDWLNTGTTQGVRVVNGFLSVNLGSRNPFGTSVDWNQDTLWLSMQIGNTSTCTISTNFQTDCGGDGEMVPMQRMTAAPYALNSDRLNGLTSDQFVQLAQGLQTDASNANSISINKTGTGNILNLQASGSTVFTLSNTGDILSKHTSATAFQIQNGTSQVLFLADTSAQKIAIGPGAATSTGVLTVGTNTTSNTGGISFGTDTNLFRSGNAALTTNASLSAANLTSGGDLALSSSAMNAGAITKNYVVGTTGVNTFDVVVLTNVPDVQQTSAARDSQVLGVSKSTASSGGSATVVVSGNYRVNVDLSAVNIGDQLVTSATAGRATVDNNATTGIVGIALSSKGSGVNGTVSVLVRPVGGQYTPTFRASATSATAFQIQNNNGINFMNVDTSGNNVNIGATGSTSTSINIHIADSTTGPQTVTIGSTNTSSTTNIQSGSNGINLYGNTQVQGSATFNTGTGTVGLNGDVTIASGKSFTQSGGGAFSTGSGTNSLNGATTVTGTNTFTVNGGNTSLGANLDVTGSVAYKQGADFSTAGTVIDANFANASLIRLTGATTQTITGIAGGRNGYVLTIINAGSTTAKLTNEDVNSAAINRITTGTGTSLSLPVGSGVTLVYDSTSQRWRVSGATSNSLQAAYNVSTTPQITLSGVSGNGGLVIQDASTPLGAGVSLFTVQSNGGSTKYLDVNSTTVAITDDLTVSGKYNTNTFTSTQLQFGGTSGTISSGSGNLTVQASGANALLLDSAGAGTVDLANTHATLVNIAANDLAHTIHIGDGGATTVQTINIGSTATAGTAVNISAGSTGGINLSGNTTLAANSNFTQNGTGTLTTGSGAVALNGDTTLASGKNFLQNGAGTFTTGTGAVSLNGITTVKANSPNAFQVQNTSNFSVLVVNTTGNQLRVYDGAGGTGYALIYYDSGTSTANFTTASGSTVAVGTGAGAINITAGSSAAVSITANAASVWRTTAGSLTLQSGGSSDLILNPGSQIVNVNGASVVKLGQSTSDPATCTAGAIIYNTTTSKIRGCQGSTLGWTDLGVVTATLQSAYTASTGGSTPEIKVDSTRTGFDIQDADTSIGGVLFAVRRTNAAGLGTSLFNVDTSNNSVNIGTSVGHSTNPIILVLDNYSNGGADPTGVVGAMYYNGTNGKFRCYDGTWRDCMTGYNEITKTADQAATQNTTNMLNDSKLFFAMAANTNYVFDAYIPIDDSNAAGGQYTFTAPTGAVINISTSNYNSGTGTTANNYCNITTSGTACTLTGGTATYAANFIQVHGFIRNSSTAGNLQFQFAQTTPTLASFPVVKAGAVLSWRTAN